MLSLVTSLNRQQRRVAPPPAGGGGGGDPTWLSGTALNTWKEIAGTRPDSAMSGYANVGGVKAYIMAYSGGAVKQSGSELIVFGGGHGDYGGNEVLTCRLANNAPAWVARRPPSDPAPQGTTGYYPDGRPRTRHSYAHLQFIDQDNKFMLFGGGSLWNAAGGANTSTVDGFSFDTNDWDPAGTFADLPGGIIAESQPVAKDAAGNVYIQAPGGSADLVRWNQSTKTFTNLGSRTVVNSSAYMCVDTTNNRMVKFDGSLSRVYNLASSASEATLTFSGAQAAQGATSRSIVWVPDLNRFLIMAWSGNTIYQGVWTSATNLEITVYSVSGTAPPAPPGDGTGTVFGRFNHCPELKLITYVRSTSDNVWCFRYATP